MSRNLLREKREKSFFFTYFEFPRKSLSSCRLESLSRKEKDLARQTFLVRCNCLKANHVHIYSFYWKLTHFHADSFKYLVPNISRWREEVNKCSISYVCVSLMYNISLLFLNQKVFHNRYTMFITLIQYLCISI